MSLQPGDIMVRDYEMLFPARQVGRDSKETHIKWPEINGNHTPRQQSYCWYRYKSRQLQQSILTPLTHTSSLRACHFGTVP